MAERGVDVARVVRSTGTPTGVTFVVLQPDGERSFFPYRHLAADKEIGPDDIPADVFHGARVVHLGANCMALPASDQATSRVLELAVRGGACVSFDPNLRRHFHLGSPAVMERVRALAGGAHLVKLSREETEPLYGSLDAMLARLFAGPAQLVVETRDREGAAWWTRDGRAGTDAGFPRDVVDATGAGDAFMAGLLSALLAGGWPPEGLHALSTEALAAAVRSGNRFGAHCVGLVGAAAGWPALAPEGSDPRAWH
jgi:fructokinase